MDQHIALAIESMSRAMERLADANERGAEIGTAQLAISRRHLEISEGNDSHVRTILTLDRMRLAAMTVVEAARSMSLEAIEAALVEYDANWPRVMAGDQGTEK